MRATGNRISVQVSLSGYSFSVEEEGAHVKQSGWLGADRIFTTPEFQRRYDEVQLSLLTPKCTLVPSAFYSEDNSRAMLSGVVELGESDQVSAVPVEEFSAWLVYSNSIGESLSKVISQSLKYMDGDNVPVLPEMYWILKSLKECPEYNKIIASYRDGFLHLAVAQGKSLMLSNIFPAADFTTAEYFIFNVMKQLQLNPEVSSVYFRTPLDIEEEMSLYRYFKAVVRL